MSSSTTYTEIQNLIEKSHQAELTSHGVREQKTMPGGETLSGGEPTTIEVFLSRFLLAYCAMNKSRFAGPMTHKDPKLLPSIFARNFEQFNNQYSVPPTEEELKIPAQFNQRYHNFNDLGAFGAIALLVLNGLCCLIAERIGAAHTDEENIFTALGYLVFTTFITACINPLFCSSDYIYGNFFQLEDELTEMAGLARFHDRGRIIRTYAGPFPISSGPMGPPYFPLSETPLEKYNRAVRDSEHANKDRKIYFNYSGASSVNPYEGDSIRVLCDILKSLEKKEFDGEKLAYLLNSVSQDLRFYGSQEVDTNLLEKLSVMLCNYTFKDLEHNLRKTLVSRCTKINFGVNLLPQFTHIGMPLIFLASVLGSNVPAVQITYGVASLLSALHAFTFMNYTARDPESQPILQKLMHGQYSETIQLKPLTVPEKSAFDYLNIGVDSKDWTYATAFKSMWFCSRSNRAVWSQQSVQMGSYGSTAQAQELLDYES